MARARIFYRTILILATAGASLWVVTLALPRMQASLNFLPVETAIKAYYLSGELPQQDLPDLIERAGRSIDINPHFRFYDDLSLLHMLHGMSPDASLNLRRQSFESSLQYARESLARSPGQPGLWLRCAELSSRLFVPSVEIAEAFKMSVYTGRVEPTLLIPRLVLGYRYLNQFDREAQMLVADQTALAWSMQERETTRALKTGILRVDTVAALLRHTHPDVVGEIEAELGVLAQ
jgi:hypothetical protein